MAYDDLATALLYFHNMKAADGEDKVYAKLNAWRDQLREMAKAGINVAQAMYVLNHVHDTLSNAAIQVSQSLSDTESQPGPEAYKRRNKKPTF
jgi:hypothetical protein